MFRIVLVTFAFDTGINSNHLKIKQNIHSITDYRNVNE